MKSKRIAPALAAGLLLSASAWAADTGQIACMTTRECNERAAKTGAKGDVSSATENTTSRQDQLEDQFYWAGKINRASAVMLTEEKIVTLQMGRKLASGVDRVLVAAAQPGAKRPSDMLQIERMLSDLIGPDSSIIHTGRSRQDMLATYRRAKLRNQLLDFSDALNGLRERFVALAGKNVDTLIPAYTNGVQAQPISYAHYLLAYEAAFERDAQRIHEAYARVNRSAMGAGVLANSIWPLNRARMAELLGFDGFIENSFDATQVNPSDVAIEATAIVSSVAVRLGMIVEYIHTQYHQTRPWLYLGEGATYTSSAMPQKANPGLVMRIREEAANVIGLAHTVTLRSHNVDAGMTDYKIPWAEIGFFPHAMTMIRETDAVMGALVVDPRRALEELEGDWTTSMELAEFLQRDNGIPFRVGHSFGSAVVLHAKEKGFTPRDFPYAKAVEFYSAALRKAGLPDARLPMSEEEFHRVLSPRYMVETRVGAGGPQPAEVKRMLAASRKTLDSDKAWMVAARKRLADADARLDDAFERLAGTSK
jgi:argininosuccinate lyase